MKFLLVFISLCLASISACAEDEFGGVGMVLCCETNQSFPRVEAVVPGPARKAGIRTGFLLISIDGVGTKGKSTADCVKLIRGHPDTSVVLECIDPKQKQTNKFTVTRVRIRDETGKK